MVFSGFGKDDLRQKQVLTFFAVEGLPLLCFHRETYFPGLFLSVACGLFWALVKYFPEIQSDINQICDVTAF